MESIIKWVRENVKIYETEMYVHVKDIESMGYKTIYFEQLGEVVEDRTTMNENTTIENEVIKLRISKENGIVIMDKETKKRNQRFLYHRR